MKYTITQEFTYASITIHNCGATEDSITDAMEPFIEAFGKEAVHFDYTDENSDGDNFIALVLGHTNGSPYYEYEAEVEPGYPAKINAPAEDCYPGADTAVYCYPNTMEMLLDVVGEIAYDYDVEDEECDDEDYLREQWYILNEGDDDY